MNNDDRFLIYDIEAQKELFRLSKDELIDFIMNTDDLKLIDNVLSKISE